MSYTCITQEELDRRGLCADVSCTRPSIIRETIFEPILEPLFVSDSTPTFAPGGRFGGRPRKKPHRPWQPRHQQVLHPDDPGGSPFSPAPSGASSLRLDGTSRGPIGSRPSGASSLRLDSTTHGPSGPRDSAMVSYGTSYSSRQNVAPTQMHLAPSSTARTSATQATQASPRMVSYRSSVSSRQNAAPAQMHLASSSMARGSARQASAPRMVAYSPPMRSMKGLGQAITDSVSASWKYAAFGLGALAVAQFFMAKR